MYAPSETWDLDVLFPGGPTSVAFAEALTTRATELAAITDAFDALGAIQSNLDGWRAAIAQLIDLEETIWNLEGVAHCHNSAHTDDEAGRVALGRANELLQSLEQLWTTIHSALGPLDDPQLEALTTGPLEDRRHHFLHIREGQRLRLEPKLQALLTEVDREALHGWGQLYDLLTGPLSAPFERDGETLDTSVGQLSALSAHPDPDVRKRAFMARNGAYETIQDSCATILTHLTGTRQMRLDRVGGTELADTLHDNRIDQDVLDAMWAGVATRKPLLARYLDLKAKALGHSKLDWWDQAAPIGRPPGGESLSWPDAQALIVDAFRTFEPDLADFSVRLLKEGGVEAEDRPHKRSGGYCMPVPTLKTSRIFMTYSGTVDNAITLAHELGHAWHSDVLYSVPRGRRQITSGLAESASTFAESIVRDQILSAATDPQVQLFMLDQQLQAGVGFLMNIDARYQFERTLYALRRNGPMSAAQLTETMLEAERTAYHDRLASWDPMFWVSKLHFYISHFGFYNWPYTFGYLFSSAIYARAHAEGEAFRPQLRELLLRTGWQDCRGLARDALGEDLTDPAFWESATLPLEQALTRFEALVD